MSSFQTPKGLLLLALSIFVMSAARADEPPAAEPQSIASDSDALIRYELTPEEYADLRAYVNEAVQILSETERESRALGGVALYRRLYSGVRRALRHSLHWAGLDPRHEMLLFRSVLRRTVAIRDLILNPGGAAPANSHRTTPLTATPAQLQAASTVLLAGLRSALIYQSTEDAARLASQTIVEPDWSKFALLQVPVLMRIANLAPSAAAKQAIVYRALGWTANTLQRAPERRRFSESITLLGETMEMLNSSEISVETAQSRLIQVQTQVATTRGEAQPAGANTVFPDGSAPGMIGAVTEHGYGDAPAAGTYRRRTSTFPLIEAESRLNAGQFGNSHIIDEHDGSAGIYGGVEIGAGVVGAGHQLSDGFTAVNARANFIFTGWVSGDYRTTDSDGNVDYGFAYGHSNVNVDAQVLAGINPEMPVYQMRLRAGAAGMTVFGVFAAIEANQLPQFSDLLVRFGYSPSSVIRLGGTDYILIRAGYTPALVQNTPIPIGSGSFMLGSILRVAKFLVDFQFNYDWQDDNGDNSRLSVEGGVAIPLSALVTGDTLRLMASHIRYDSGADAAFTHSDGTTSSSISTTTLGAFYGLQW